MEFSSPVTEVPPEKTVKPSTKPSVTDKNYFFEGTENPTLKKSFGYLDRFQDWLGGYVEDVGESADAFFGSEEAFDRTQGSRLDILTPVTFHAGGKIDTSIRFRAKLALPRTNKRWNLIITSAEDSLRELANEGTTTQTNSSVTANNPGLTGNNTTNATSVGLRYMLDVKDYSQSFLGFGLNFRNVVEPDPYVRAKGTYKWKLTDHWYSRMTQDLFWENYAGVGLHSKQVFDYQLDDLNLLRSETYGTWWDKDQYYELHQAFYFYQRMSKHRAIAYHVGWDWDTQNTGFHMTSYHAGLNLRERIYKEWLFFEIEPRVDFYQETAFTQADPNITFMLEAQFYQRHKN
ncbi:MAG: hypothetical protein R3219_09660 [Hydrogenovibrio sp.]|nr:hypothetical protein [Hydrogenovibrio sp.]